MAITTQLVGKLGGKGGYIWQPTPGVTYDLGANYPSRMVVSYVFSATHSLYVNDTLVSSSAITGYWILPDEKNIPNPRYIRITGGSAETANGKFICVTPVTGGLAAPAG